MSAARFLTTAMLAFSGALLGIAAINHLVDPYLVFGQQRRPGLNHAKPAADNREWMMKAYEVRRHNPTTVILGSSRTDIGLSPESQAWPQAWSPVYNLSLAGSDLALSLHYLRHLLSVHGSRSALRNLVVGLDFESFLLHQSPQAAPADARELESIARLDALAADGPLARQRVWQDRAEALFTLDALLDSGLAVLASRSASPGVDLSSQGQLGDGHLRKWAQTDGVLQLFKQKSLETLRSFKPPRRHLDAGSGSMHGQPQLAALLDLARQHKLKLVLLIQPSHASRLEMLDAMGYWADFERWKRTLTALSDAAKASGVDVTLWDFGGFEPENLEPMPAEAAARTPLRWYWDPVHYRPALGDHMLAAVTSDNAGKALAPLSLATIDARLQRVKDDRRAFRLRDAASAAQWRQLVCPGIVCAHASAP